MERNLPKISVVVPVYNVEAYVDKCLASLAGQTYPNVEIIAVDDASADNGGGICDAWAERDNRFQAVHFPENRGLCAARNEGVRRASGAYIAFVDSDDYAEPTLIEALYRALMENGADVSVCGDDGLGLETGPAAVYSKAEAVRCMARRRNFLWTAWGKLFPAPLAKEYPFDPRAVCCEDLLFFYQILQRVDRIAYVPDPLYHYVFRQGSAVNEGVTEKRCAVLPILDEICEDAYARLPELADSFRQIAMNTSVRLAMQAVECGTPEGPLSGYLKRFQKHVRRHFTWEALALRPGKKDGAAELLLFASTTAFQAAGTVFRQRKAAKG